ncbi:MAG: hypothetical protein K2O10_04665, partial [Muribaculaceae bacterium]|nr:hypothetical protein [Muribaculaceae bacterium]
MKTAIFSSRLTAIALTAIMGVGSVLAQSYYDDDIYYDPAKAKKEQKKKAEKKPAQTYDAVSGQYYYDGAGYVPWNNVGDFQSADTYVPAGGSTRDVDEYNRHSTTTAQPDSISLEQYEAMAENMANTRNLARFHDSEVAKEAYNNDDYYADAYNAGYNEGYSNGISQPQTSLVVSVNSGWPYYNTWPYYSAWYNPYRYWGWNSWYDPYWSWNWGPSWSWG